MMTSRETSVHAALSEVHVYAHFLNEKSQNSSELGMTESILLVQKLKPSLDWCGQLVGHCPAK